MTLMPTRLFDLGVADLGRAFAGRSCTPLDVADACLARIDARNPELNAVLQVDRDAALAAARASGARWARGAPLSPVDGVPIGVKANIAVRGLAWHAGVGAYRARRASEDAACVARLRAGGAVVLGVLNMDEAALGALGENAAFGRCGNPRARGLSPGGSSSGAAAAVASGFCGAALGTDTLGSVRIPASYCGVYGFKPAHGLVSAEGVTPLCPSLDDVGVVARSAGDVAAVMSLLTPRTGSTPACDLGAMRLAVLVAADVRPSAEVEAAFDATLERAAGAGASLVRVELEPWDAAALRRAALLVCEVDGYAEHAAALARDPDGFSPRLRDMLRFGARASEAKLAEARHRLEAAGEGLRAALDGFDAALSPTTPQTAFAATDRAPVDQADYTVLANVSGLAAAAFPVGASAARLPLSVQAIGRSGAACLALAGRLGTDVAIADGPADQAASSGWTSSSQTPSGERAAATRQRP